MQTFSSARLREARKAAGLTQRQLADAANTNETRISNWERGVWTPKINALPALALVLGRELAYFFEEAADEQPVA